MNFIGTSSDVYKLLLLKSSSSPGFHFQTTVLICTVLSQRNNNGSAVTRPHPTRDPLIVRLVIIQYKVSLLRASRPGSYISLTMHLSSCAHDAHASHQHHRHTHTHIPNWWNIWHVKRLPGKPELK